MLRRTITTTALLLCVLVLIPRNEASGQPRPRWAAPPLRESVSVRDGRSGAVVSFDAMLDALATADAVFLGETHTDETTHRVELAVYEALLERREGRVVLALEMFERDVQSQLDAYLAGDIDEATFLAKCRPWNNYDTAYRPLIERAKKAGRTVVASNFPRSLRMKFMGQGDDPLQKLTPTERKLVPRQYFPNSDAYWRRADNATRGHTAMMRTSNNDSRLYNVQSLWDNSMGQACADALDAHPGHVILHVNGGFHTAYWDGTAHQLSVRKPEAKVKTVSIVPAINPATVELEGEPVADFVVFAEARASDLNEGTWSVYAPQEIKYRLHLPDSASPTHKVPLLIWLSDDGLTSSDGLDLWQGRLGSDMAIAVIEAPHQETQGDFSVGGRWFWPDSFASDIGTMVSAVERVWGYVLRHHAIDPTRVCVAGEGAGATVVAGIALLADRMDLHAIAVTPARYAKLRDIPLPLAELYGDATPPQKSLRVIAGPDDQKWWADELEQYTHEGIESHVVPQDDDPWQREAQEENAIRQAMGLDVQEAAVTTTRRFLLADPDLPRQQHWARLHALWAAAESGDTVAVLTEAPTGTATELPTTLLPESFTTPEALPQCPGPFGGTTVIVVPEADPATKQWLAIEENDPLSKFSRFHRVRVATVGEGERSLPNVLKKLKTENRKNILIVPGVFCAEPRLMQQLKRSVRELENEMTFHWLPGLGGRKVKLAATPSAATDLPLEHSLFVKLKPDEHWIEVRDSIELPASLRQAGAEFTLNSDLKITSSTPKVEKAGAGDAEGMTRYRLLAAPKGDDSFDLTYEGNIHHGLSEQKEEYTRGFRQTKGFIGPEGIYLDGGSGWVPRFNEQLIRFQVFVKPPTNWHTISQGVGSRGEDGWDKSKSGGLMEQVYLVGGPLHRYSDLAGTTEAVVFLHEKDDALARRYLDATAQYLEMYRQLIGPYPYEKFALVENFWETGYGMPSFTLLGPQVIRLPFILHSSYPHEILHNWWGNSVFVDYESGNWCEGLTAYLADHLVQEQRGLGADYRRNALQKYRNYVRQERDFPLSEFRERHNAATEAVGYGKALMMFHMVRQQIGDDAFRAALAGFYRKQKEKRASFADLREEFEAAGQCDLKAFFQQWTERTGAPALALENVAARRTADGVQVTGVLVQTQAGEPYVLQVPVVVQTKEGSTSATVDCTERRTEFSLAAGAEPLALHVDPQFDLFRLLDPRETPASIGQIYGEPHILAVLPAAEPDAKRKLYQELMEAWRSENHAIEMVLDKDIESLPHDRGVWVLGRENRFATDLMTAAGDNEGKAGPPQESLQLDTETVALANHAIVVIRRHSQNLEKAVGLLIVEPDSAFPGMARKLPHYGKYSYLAFEGTEPTNVVKGQWGSLGSPLVVLLGTGSAEQLADVSLEPREPLAQLPPVFSSQTLQRHVAWLSDPEREGRGLGSQGLKDSAYYIVKQMMQAQLKPGGDDGTWFQEFTVAEGADGKPVKALNVVGILPGKRESWNNESIVLGAHYDHLGFGWPDVRAQAQGKLHPGADDNASGVAVMLELAKNLAAQGGGSRNLVCVAFAAEECGRWGSKHYVAHPSLPLEGIRGAINLDTVGRLFDGKIAVHATGTADEWQHIFRGCGFVTGIPNQIVPGGDEGSDQMSFIEQGIPAVHIFTGAHGDYHSPRDSADKIDVAGLVKVATFVKEAVVYMLERETPLTVRIEGAGAARSQPAEPTGSGRRVLVGTVPAFDYQGEGAKVDSLVPDSPAAKAGLQPGDVIQQIDDHVIRDLRGYSDVLKQLAPNQTVTFEVLRDGKKVRVKVTVVER